MTDADVQCKSDRQENIENMPRNSRFHSGHFALEAKGGHGGKKKTEMCTF